MVVSSRFNLKCIFEVHIGGFFSSFVNVYTQISTGKSDDSLVVGLGRVDVYAGEYIPGGHIYEDIDEGVPDRNGICVKF